MIRGPYTMMLYRVEHREVLSGNLSIEPVSCLM